MNLKWGPSSQLVGTPASDLRSRERAAQGGAGGCLPLWGVHPAPWREVTVRQEEWNKPRMTPGLVEIIHSPA